VVSDSAWKNGGCAEYEKNLQRALDDAHAGKASVLIVWPLDWSVREGAEDALRLLSVSNGATALSCRQGKWLNGSPEVQDILVTFASWMAKRELARCSERIRVGLVRRHAEGGPVGRRHANQARARQS